jgi:type II secretory pathway pseudopilin PulG
MIDTFHEEDSEAGYLLLAVVVMVALMLIALSVAAPVVTRELRRDKEVESEHRAEQYVRAIRLYYRKSGGYPPSIEALGKSNNIRFLRQKYVDPLTGKSDWRMIHQPQTKTHYPFGQELSGLTASMGSAAGMVSGGNATTTVGSVSGLAAGFGGASVASPTSPGTNGAVGATGSAGSTGSTGSSDSAGMFGDSNGGVIYGVGPNRTGESILTPNQQTSYEKWEFWYDPLIEQLYTKGSFTGGGGIGSQSAASFGQNGVTGQPNGATGPSSGTVAPTPNPFGTSGSPQ